MLLSPGISFTQQEASGTPRYWVLTAGGAWDSTAGSKWSTTSGGSAGASVPTLANDVFFDANSGSGIITGAVVGAIVCKTLNFTNFTGNFNTSVNLKIYGSLILGASMTRSFTGGLTFLSNYPGKTITSNGISIGANDLTFAGAGGSWTVQDAISNPGASIILRKGTLNINGQTVSTGTMNADSQSTQPCSLILGASTLTVTIQWITTGSGLTISAASSTINFTGVNLFYSKSATYGTLNLTSTSQTSSLTNATIANDTFNGPLTFSTLSRTNASGYVVLNLQCDIIVTTSLTLTGSDASTRRLGVLNTLFSSPITITCNGSITLTNVDFQGIIGAGSATWTGTSIGDCGGNTNITFTSPVTRFLVTAAGSNDFMGNIWSTSSGGSVGATQPLPQDTVTIDANSFASGSRTLVVAVYRMPGLDFTNATNSPTLSFGSASSSPPMFVGDLKFIAGMTVSTGTTSSCSFSKQSGTQTLTTAGKTMPVRLFLRGNSTFTFADTFTSTSGLSWVSGTINDNNLNLTMTTFLAVNSTTVTGATRSWAKGTGTLTLSGSSVVLEMINDGSITFTDSGTTKFTNNSSSSKFLNTGGFTYNNFYNNTTGTGALIINSDFLNTTFNDFKCDAGRTNRFQSGTTTTFQTLTMSGSAGNLTVITSSPASAQHFLVSTGGNVSLTFMNIAWSNASGASFSATSSTNSLNNNGWIITP